MERKDRPHRSNANYSKPDGDRTSTYFQDGGGSGNLSAVTMKSIMKECLQDLELKISDISNTTTTILAEQKKMSDRVTKVEENCVEMQKSLEFTADDVAKLQQRVEALESQVVTLRSVSEQNTTGEAEITTKCLSNDRYSRGYNLRFGGIQETDKEDCVAIVTDILKDKFGLTGVLIDNAHRVPVKTTRKESDKPRHIIVKFPIRQQRSAILVNKRDVLRGSNVFITVDLCKTDYETKKRLRQVMKTAYEDGHKVRFINGELFINNKLYRNQSGDNK